MFGDVTTVERGQAGAAVGAAVLVKKKLKNNLKWCCYSFGLHQLYYHSAHVCLFDRSLIPYYIHPCHSLRSSSWWLWSSWPLPTPNRTTFWSSQPTTYPALLKNFPTFLSNSTPHGTNDTYAGADIAKDWLPSMTKSPKNCTKLVQKVL